MSTDREVPVVRQDAAARAGARPPQAAWRSR